jgi:hypothetical protein
LKASKRGDPNAGKTDIFTDEAETMATLAVVRTHTLGVLRIRRLGASDGVDLV